MSGVILIIVPLPSTENEGTPKSHKRPTPVIVCTPPVQRKIMQIPTAILDLDNEGFSSGDEMVQKNIYRKSNDNLRSLESYSIRGDRITMPPEIIVTSSTQGQDSSARSSRSHVITKAHKGHLNVKKAVSRRGSAQRLSPVRTKQLSRQLGGDISDPESRLPTEINIPFKQQFWRVPISENLHSSHGSAQSQDQVLKACSVKLAELKKRHKSKKDKVEQDLAGLPLRQPVRRKQKQRRTKSMRYESSGNYQIENSGLLKIKPFKSTDQKKVISETVNKNAKKIPNKKFRKGGIVSLATVSSHHTVRVESASGDDSLENAGNKKKKKKRKIFQIQKHIKTAVTAVAAVTVSKKESTKNISRKKN